MPTFTEHAGTDRNLRVLAALAPPLPQGSQVLTSTSPDTSRTTNPPGHYDVVIVGAGPAGLFLKLLLARYGLGDASVLCVDEKPGTLQTGQADGLQPRTLEVLATLGLGHEVLSDGCAMWEVGFWNEAPDGSGGIARTSYAPDVVARARFPHEITIHQGRIERILSEDLARYSTEGVRHGTRLVGLKVLEGTEAEGSHGSTDAPGSGSGSASNSSASFPVEVELEHASPAPGTPSTERVRARHVVAADGAHSVTRGAAGLRLEGESRDHIWGVVDFVADSDFPDLRRRCAIHSAAGSAMVIPRERIASGEYLTRLYIQMDDVEAPDGGGGGENRDGGEGENGAGAAGGPNGAHDEALREQARSRRSRVTLDTLFTQAAAVFQPYHLRMKAGTEPDWWAAYQIGQRMANAFTHNDAGGVPRVFLAGDAAHTHSPKAGQGMNVSLMDSYNLAWKLAFHLHQLCPSSYSLELLHTYSAERAANALNLIDFDTRFSGMFSGKLGSTTHDESGEELTHERFLEVFTAGSGFSSGCGIEYEPSLAVAAANDGSQGPWLRANWPADKQSALLRGALWPGRRLVSLRVVRHADGVPMQLHEALPSTGRFRVVLLLGSETGGPEFAASPSWAAVQRVGGWLDSSQVVRDVLGLIVLHPVPSIRGRPWADFPPALKTHAEMAFFCAAPGEAPEGKEEGVAGLRGVIAEDGYNVLGVCSEVGAWAAVRPDGVVGAMGSFGEIGKLEEYLGRMVPLIP